MFSLREKRIIEILGKKNLTIKEISTKLFEDNPYAPFDSEISVSNSVTRIIKKCKHYELPWTLNKHKSSSNLLTIRMERKLC